MRFLRAHHVLLHGRDATMTEVKFISAAESAKEADKNLEAIIIEPYGRGNNAYRWAGEADVDRGSQWHYFADAYPGSRRGSIGNGRVVIRGFSMGGAGTWHLGLHHPGDFIAPLAGAASR